MITIERIEVVNFRSIPYAVVEPDLNGGITALTGQNGAGKTSLVHAINWAIMGVTPDDVNVRGLRRQGSDGQEVRATVTFRHDGQVIEATRMLKGKNDTTHAFIKVDGVEATNVKTRAAVSWMENRLGIDADGFLTALVVRQKELDSLIKARPADRKRQIERLAGIERLDEAASRARGEETDARKTLAMLPGSDEELSAAEAVLTNAISHADTLVNAAREQAAAAATLARAAEEATAAADNAEQQARAKATQQQTVDRLTTNLERARESQERINRTITDLLDAAEGGDQDTIGRLQHAASQAQTALESLQAQSRDAAEAHGRADTLAQQAASAGTQAAAREAAVAQARTRLAAMTAPADLSDIDARLATAKKALADAQAKRADAQAEYRRLAQAIQTLSTVHDPSCPTCAQPLNDPDALVSSLQTAQTVIVGQGTSAKADEESAERTVNAIEGERRAAERDAAAYTAMVAELDRIEQEAAAATTAAATAAEQAAAAKARAAEFSAATPQVIAQAASDAQAARDRFLAAQRAAEALTRLEQARREGVEMDRAVADLTQQVTDALSVLHQMPGDEETTRRAVEAAQTARDEAARAASAATSSAADARVAAAAVDERTRDRDRERAKVDARKVAVNDLQAKAAVREALDAFRMDRLARIAPELAEVATDLVVRMTNGRYVAVDFDENFTPILTDSDGFQRPSSWLSGGEESVVALAVRVGIGEIISGSRGGLLVLDEVLSAQDAERRNAMLAAIRELPGRQVIMINHVAESLDIADRGYLVAPNGDGEIEVTSIAAGDGDRVIAADLILTDA
jgi:exonuclease SbcC